MIGVAVAALLASAPLEATAPAQGLRSPSTVSYYWRWSDGSLADTRTLAEPASGRPPSLIVTATPARQGRPVELQFRDAAGWHTEDVATTGRGGVAVLQINPFCEDGAWCDRQFTYRLRVEGRTAVLRVRFIPDASSAS